MKFQEVEFTFEKRKKPNRKFDDEYEVIKDNKKKKKNKRNFEREREAKRGEYLHTEFF